MQKQKQKQYGKQYKEEAVKRVDESEYSLAAVARELGINENTLRGWVRDAKENPNPFPGSGKVSYENEDELKKLQRRNRELQEEIEILKKAAAYFAKNLK
ncbi:MAG: transposase [Bacillota bacterium]|nr:MAG: transposase [Bacillota bacterium]